MQKRTKRLLWMLLISVLAVSISACTGGEAEPTQDPNMIFTQVAETVMVSMTQTAEAAPPTATPEPTATQMPTLPPTATVDPNQPTATPQQSLPTGPTATTQRYGDVAKWNTQSPVDGTVMEKRNMFPFHVCIGNIGSTDWTTKYYLEYVDGAQLWVDQTQFFIGEIVEPNGKWCFDLPSIAPNVPGEYITRWYLKNEADVAFFEVYFHFYVSE